ncbi:MAG TPA: hypothetical protein VHO25_16200 [Polyangiaceae bacterium]|nr:hypothetical protein [Polyangiaceae bacterium]
MIFSLRGAAAWALGCALFSFTGETLGAAGDTSLALGAGTRWVQDGQFGPLLEVQAGRGIAESWLLVGSLGGSHQPAEDFSVLNAGLGAAWRWDVIQWVPEFALQLRVYEFVGSGAPPSLDGFELGASATLAVDRLLSRNWALGLAGQGHALFTAADHVRLPMLDASLRVRYQWD